MKIRPPVGLGIEFLRAWMSTVRFRLHEMTPNVVPHRAADDDRYIYAFWHESLLLPAKRHAHPKVHVLISQHADGQLITDAILKFGFSVVRGSTTRGALQALRELLRVSRTSHIAITPDGPRGPRRVAQAGLVFLASRTGLPIVPCGYAYGRTWRARSWDGFQIPKPFTRGYGVIGDPFHVPPGLDEQGIARELVRAQAELDRVTAIAEDWARTGKLNDNPAPADGGSETPRSETCPTGSSTSSPVRLPGMSRPG